jgi:hypothetical protein
MNRPGYWDARFKDLPLLTSKPAPMDDEAIAFDSDIQYMHLLLGDITLLTGRGATQQQPTYEWVFLHEELIDAGKEMANITKCYDRFNARAFLQIAGWSR